MAKVYTAGSRNKLHAEFDSVKDVFRVIDKLGWKPANGKSSDDRGRGDFQTFDSLREARDVYENHPEQIRQFFKMDDMLKLQESPGNDVYFDITGDFIDIDRALEGVPEVFGNATMGNPRTIFCTINILTAYVWSTSIPYIMEKQKRILRLVDWLENQGIRCQIVATEDSECLYMSTVVKQFHDPLDLNMLAVVMHPDWLRRIVFLIEEQSNTWSYGYGNTIEYDNKMKKFVPQPEDGLYVYVGGYIPHSGNDLKALNAEFDNIELVIKETIDKGMTFNEDPMAVKGGRW